MKTKLILLLSLGMTLMAVGQTITSYTTTTNYPSVTLTVAPDSTLLANGVPFRLYLSGLDFTISNNIIQLVNHGIAFTNTTTGSPGTAAAVTNLGGGFFQLTIPAGQPGTNGLNGTNGSPGSPGTNATVVITNTISLPPYSQPTVTNLGDGTVVILQYGIPVVPTNVVLSCNQLLAYQTNNIVWGTSNYIGSVPAIGSVDFFGGEAGPGGMNPALTNITQNLYCSTNGGTSWFLIETNGGDLQFTTTNSCLLSVSGAGGGLGGLSVYYLDYPDAAGRTNGHYAGVDFYPDPTLPAQPATKNYTDNAILNALNNGLTTTVSNGVTITTFSQNGVVVWQTTSTQPMLPVAYARSGTNILISTPQTNLVAGWQLTVSTNLAIQYSFVTTTNYLLSTNSGIVTFTIRIDPTVPIYLFKLVGSGINSSTAFYVPVQMPEAYFVTNTITASTNSTFGYGAGLMTCDTNYVYVSIGTNNWRRITIPTNTW